MYSRSVSRFVKNYQMNLVIKILIVSDFLIWSANQLLTPIFAIYITDSIIDGSLEVVGIAASLYLLSKSIFEIPVGAYLDKSKSETRELWSAMIGTMITALVYFAYIFIDSITELYLLQIILGLGAAIAFPGWYAIFTHHVDKGKEAFEWSMYDVLLGLGMAAAAFIGGFIADHFGFKGLFFWTGLFTLVGALFLLMIRKKIYKRVNVK